MRAPTLLLPRMISLSLLVCPMMLVDVSPSFGAEGAPESVGSAYRGAPAADRRSQSDPAPWNNRTATPAANNMNPRGPQGVQLRPRTAPTGIFSSALGEVDGGAANRRTAAGSMPAAGGRNAGAERTKGLVPQFMSLFSSKVPQPKPSARGPMNPTTSAAAAPHARSANWANQSSPPGGFTAANGQPTGRAAMAGQPAYRTAAATQSYRYPGAPANAPAGSRPRSHSSRPTPPATAEVNAARLSRPTADGRPWPVTKPAARGSASPRHGGSAASEAFIQIHQLAESARTEADFSQVFLACREIATGQGATAEEVAFGKELASWALNRRGQLKAAAGRTDEALADFDTAIGLDPKRWRAIHNRGVLLAQSGHFEQAFDDFQHTTDLNPRYAKAFSNRAALYTLAGDPEAALDDYTRAVELDPKLAVAQRGLGRTYHMLGGMGEALEHLNAAVELKPDDAAALTSRGDLLTDLGHYADAADDYERALEINANSVDACRSSAWLLATCPDDSVRNPNLALQRAQLAVQRERKVEAETYNVLAAAQASAGDYQQAVRSTLQAIELAPPSERALYEDRLEMYRQSTPLRIAPAAAVQQAQYQR